MRVPNREPDREPCTCCNLGLRQSDGNCRTKSMYACHHAGCCCLALGTGLTPHTEGRGMRVARKHYCDQPVCNPRTAEPIPDEPASPLQGSLASLLPFCG